MKTLRRDVFKLMSEINVSSNVGFEFLGATTLADAQAKLFGARDLVGTIAMCRSKGEMHELNIEVHYRSWEPIGSDNLE